MSQPAFERLEQLFFELVDLGDAERMARLAILEGGGDDDRALAAAVRAMLSEDGETLFGQERTGAGDLLERVEEMARPVRDELPRDVGNYRLLRRIGEGGMGAVYEAQQLRPVRRRVAVKLVKWGMDTRAVLARFDAERQTLARLEHPHIASVYDADATADGRPFFVMERVDGEPITSYCDRHELTLDQRLDLFGQLCSAVQHAHQRGVIHRDLKPTNVLVAEGDGTPRVKVIDFGIAKATELDGEATLVAGSVPLTQLGEFVGTPEYMSPEQAGLGDGAVDTRTDVYALGVVLYELLVGELPIRRQSAGRISVEEVRRMVREVDAARPSSRLRQGGTEVGRRVADCRSTTVAALGRRLKGDLDWIVLKALAKDPEHRYAAVADLGADIERHRQLLPVEAGPPSWRYRTGRFVRRNRVPVLMSAVLLLAVLVGAGLALVGLLRARAAERVAVSAQQDAEREARTATEVSTFLVDLFEATDPLSDSGPLTAAEILERGIAEVDQLEGEPLVQATLLNTFGKVYTNQGDYERAEPLIVRANELAATHADDGGELQAQVQSRLLILYRRLGRTGDAIAAGELAVEIERTLEPAPGRAGLGAALSNLASAYADAGRLDDAVAAAREAVPLCAQEKGENSNSVAFALNNLATNLMRQQQFGEAVEPLERTRDIFRDNLGSDHPYLVQVQSNLGYALGGVGRRLEAVEANRAALDAGEARLEADHPGRIVPNINLSAALAVVGRYDEAEEVLARAGRIAQARLDEGHPRFADLARHRAQLSWRRGELAAAAASSRRELEALRAFDAAADRLEPVRARLAVLALEQGDRRSAESACEPILAARPLASASQRQCALALSLVAARDGDETSASRWFDIAVAELGADDVALRDPGAAVSLAGYWAQRNDIDRAFEALELGPDRRWASSWLLERTQLQPLHDDPRWPQFALQVGQVVDSSAGD